MAKRRQGPSATRVRYYPESVIDGFSRVDSTVQFYMRVSALVDSDTVVLDFGAGRGQWLEDSSDTRRALRDFRGRAARVLGIDVDPAIKENPALDEAQVIAPGGRIPHEDSSIGVVVSDFTFEHVDDPIETAGELHRVVKPGGWVCARTPNKWGYIGVGARLVPNAWHVRWLTRLQPNRKDIDVFPVRYRLNTRKDLRRAFPPELWEHVVYTMPGEPNYAGDSRIGWSLFGALMRIQPRRTEPMLLIFLRKK